MHNTVSSFKYALEPMVVLVLEMCCIVTEWCVAALTPECCQVHDLAEEAADWRKVSCNTEQRRKDIFALALLQKEATFTVQRKWKYVPDVWGI